MSVQNITDCVDVFNIGLLDVVDFELAVLLNLQTSSWQIEALCYGVSANGKHHGVILIGLLLSVLHVGNLDATILIWFLKLGRCGLVDELGAVILHVLANLVGHSLVKTSQENRSHHDSCVISKGVQKASGFESDV